MKYKKDQKFEKKGILIKSCRIEAIFFRPHYVYRKDITGCKIISCPLLSWGGGVGGILGEVDKDPMQGITPTLDLRPHLN